MTILTIANVCQFSRSLKLTVDQFSFTFTFFSIYNLAPVAYPIWAINSTSWFPQQRLQHPFLSFHFLPSLTHSSFCILLCQTLWWLESALKLHAPFIRSWLKRTTPVRLPHTDCAWRQQTCCIACIIATSSQIVLERCGAGQVGKKIGFPASSP